MLLLDGAEHMHQRKLMLPAFHGERLRRYREIMVEATERVLAALARRASRSRCAPHAQAITLEVIVRAVFGVHERRAARRTCARWSPASSTG